MRQSSIIAISILSAIFLFAFNQQTAKAQSFTYQQRMDRIQQQRAMEARRRDYYRREQRARAIARGLEYGSRAADVAAAVGSARVNRGRPGMTTRQWMRNDRGRNFTRDIIRDQVISRGVRRGARSVFEHPRVAPHNYRFWQNLGVVQ